MANFWQSLKNNWNNGNILKWTNFGANAGMSAIATYGVMDSVFSGKSPFGCGGGWGYSGCCGGNSLYPDLGAINTIMQRNACNPMGIVNDPMAQMMLGSNSMLGMSTMSMGYPDMTGMMGGGYSMPWMNGGMNYGNYPFTTFNSPSTTSTTDNDKTTHKTYNHDAVALTTTTTTTTTPTFDKNLIGNDVTAGTDITISSNHNNIDTYKTNLKNSANALGKSWDTDNDNYVSETEFTTNFMKDYDGLTETQKKTLFVQLDLNDDNKLDANELSAMLWHMDASDASGSTATNDGKITSKGFNTWLSSIQTVAGRTKMNTYYTEKLFKED